MALPSFLKNFFKSLGSNTLYYSGCLSRYADSRLKSDCEELLGLCGQDFIEIDSEVCCGSPVLNAGYQEEFDSLVEKNKKLFKEHSVGKIVTNCPACYYFFSKHYGFQDVEVEHIVSTVEKAIISGRLRPRPGAKGKIAYHDPCHLGRKAGLYDVPRNALKLLGFEVVELEDSREQAMCCGGGGGLRANFPELSKKVALLRLSQARRTGAKTIVTPCPMCFEQLKENAGILVAKDFVEVVLDAVVK